MVSGNKSKMNLNVVKTKPAKPKFKTLAASMKIKAVSSASKVRSAVVQSVAQSLLSIASSQGKFQSKRRWQCVTIESPAIFDSS